MNDYCNHLGQQNLQNAEIQNAESSFINPYPIVHQINRKETPKQASNSIKQKIASELKKSLLLKNHNDVPNNNIDMSDIDESEKSFKGSKYAKIIIIWL